MTSRLMLTTLSLFLRVAAIPLLIFAFVLAALIGPFDGPDQEQ